MFASYEFGKSATTLPVRPASPILTRNVGDRIFAIRACACSGTLLWVFGITDLKNDDRDGSPRYRARMALQTTRYARTRSRLEYFPHVPKLTLTRTKTDLTRCAEDILSGARGAFPRDNRRSL